jgi:hypothetical protein
MGEAAESDLINLGKGEEAKDKAKGADEGYFVF